MNRDLRLALMAGIDIPIPELQISIHQPQIRDIAFMGEEDFFMSMQYLCVDKEALVQDKTLLSEFNNFQVLMKVLNQSKDKRKKSILQTVLLLLFPDRQSLILPSSITLTAKGLDPVVIDGNNFEIVQEYIKEILCVNSVFQGDNVVYNPANEAAKKIADKIMAGRKKAAESKSNGSNESILTRYISILTVGLGSMTIDDCLNLTLFQLFDLIARYNAFVEYDIDLRVRLAGGKPDKSVENWMRDLHPANKPKVLSETPKQTLGSFKSASFKSNSGWNVD